MRWALLIALLPGCTNNPVDTSASTAWPERNPYSTLGTPLALITNNFSDSISIVDLSANTPTGFYEVARAPVGLSFVEREGPQHLAVAADGEYYFVGLSNYVMGAGLGPHSTHGQGTVDGYALKIRTADHRLEARTRVDRSPGDIVLTPDQSRLLVSHFDLLKIDEAQIQGLPESAWDSTLAIIDPVAMTRLALVPVCPAAHSVAVSTDSSTAFVTCLNDRIAKVDLHTYAVELVDIVPTPGSPFAPVCAPYALTQDLGNDTLWVSCLKTGQVLALNLSTLLIDEQRNAQLPGPAYFGCMTSDGNELVVPHQGLDGLSWVEPLSGQVTGTLVLSAAECIKAHVVAPWGPDLLLVCEGDHRDEGTLVIVDNAQRMVRRVIPLGVYPDGIGFVGQP